MKKSSLRLMLTFLSILLFVAAACMVFLNQVVFSGKGTILGTTFSTEYSWLEVFFKGKEVSYSGVSVTASSPNIIGFIGYICAFVGAIFAGLLLLAESKKASATTKMFISFLSIACGVASIILLILMPVCWANTNSDLVEATKLGYTVNTTLGIGGILGLSFSGLSTIFVILYMVSIMVKPGKKRK